MASVRHMGLRTTRPYIIHRLILSLGIQTAAVISHKPGPTAVTIIRRVVDLVDPEAVIPIPRVEAVEAVLRRRLRV